MSVLSGCQHFPQNHIVCLCANVFSFDFDLKYGDRSLEEANAHDVVKVIIL